MKIMIVDDEPKIRRGMKTLLEEQDGFEVIGIYDNAMSSLSDLDEKQPNVLITDIKMPEYSGLDLIEKIREKDKNLYIIILSGYGSFKYAQRAIRSGVYRYLTKPTNPRELISVLREIDQKSTGLYRAPLCGKNRFKNALRCAVYFTELFFRFISATYEGEVLGFFDRVQIKESLHPSEKTGI